MPLQQGPVVTLLHRTEPLDRISIFFSVDDFARYTVDSTPQGRERLAENSSAWLDLAIMHPLPRRALRSSGWT